MPPGPTAPAPLSKRTRTSGVWASNSSRATVTFGALVKRVGGSGATSDDGTLDADPANWSSAMASIPPGWVGTRPATKMSRNSSHRLMVCGSVESMWPPLTMLAKTGVGLRDRVDERGPLRSRLLVLERAGEEHGHDHVLRPVDHGTPVEQRRVPPRSRAGGDQLRADDPVQVLRLPVQRLVGEAGRLPVAGGHLGIDLVVRPRLAHVRDRGGRALHHLAVAVRRRGLGVVDPGADPAGGKAVVVDAARVPGGEEVVGGAQGGDRGQRRRVGAGRGELRQTRVADAHHANPVIGHPGLVGHDLDRVVGVVVGGVAEEVERAARATGAAHLEADGGEPRQPGEHGSDVGRAVREQVRVTAIRAGHAESAGDHVRDGISRPGDVVARVLNHRRARARRRTGHAVGVPHRGGKLDAVTHGDVVETLVHRLSGVEGRTGGGVDVGRQDGEVPCLPVCGVVPPRVPRSR